MLDHVFLNSSNLIDSLDFYDKVLSHLDIKFQLKFDGKSGGEEHPDLYGFGSNNRVYFWLREGPSFPETVHIGFIANSCEAVQEFYKTALANGAKSIDEPGYRLYYDPNYYSARIADLDGYSIEAVYKNWQHKL